MTKLNLARGIIVILWFIAVYVYVQPVNLNILIAMSALAIISTSIEIFYSSSFKYKVLRIFSIVIIFIGMRIQLRGKFEEGLLTMPPSGIYLDYFLILNSTCWSFVLVYSLFMFKGKRLNK